METQQQEQPDFLLMEEKLNSFLTQLHSEYGILDRLVYKYKNQHHRSSYFQFLSKVRSDLRLFLSVHLEEILSSCFLVITGMKPAQKVHLLESLNKRRNEGGKHNFLERLLGAARILSEMTEPMLKAAIEISTLLARSFFMGFSLITLTVLARLRVLVQQILLDVVSVFNQVSSLSQTPQSVKIIQEGIEVFREYYPADEELIILECVWETDKFVLVEKIQKKEAKCEDAELSTVAPLRSSVMYQSIETFLQDFGFDTKKADAEFTEAESTSASVDGIKGKLQDAATGFSSENDYSNMGEDDTLGRDDPTINRPSSAKFSTSNGCSEASKGLTPLKRKADSGSKVAFVSVKRPAPSKATVDASHLMDVKETGTGNQEDPFFNLLARGDMKKSMF